MRMTRINGIAKERTLAEIKRDREDERRGKQPIKQRKIQDDRIDISTCGKRQFLPVGEEKMDHRLDALPYVAGPNKRLQISRLQVSIQHKFYLWNRYIAYVWDVTTGVTLWQSEERRSRPEVQCAVALWLKEHSNIEVTDAKV